MPHDSAPYNDVGTITPSYRHFLAFIPILYYSAHLSALPMLYTPFILCTTSLSHPPSAATCDPIYYHLRPQEKQSTSSNGSPFSIICIRPSFPYLENLIIYSYLQYICGTCHMAYILTFYIFLPSLNNNTIFIFSSYFIKHMLALFFKFLCICATKSLHLGI